MRSAPHLPLVTCVLLLAGCYGTSLQHVAPGKALREDRVVLVGALRTVPPITQRTWPQSTVVLPGPTAGNFYVFLTPDLEERWEDGDPTPLERYESAWLPFEGHFFLEVPAGERLYLRGVRYVTDRGWEGFELPLEVDLRGARGVVYVGELNLSRLSPVRMVVRQSMEASRREAQARGLSQLLGARWQVRLARQVSPGGTDL